MIWEVMCGFHCRTTGLDPERDRIVAASVVRYRAGRRTAREFSWVADPGVEIPAEATAAHGYTTAGVHAEGEPAGDVVAEVIAELAEAVAEGLPLVVRNAAVYLTLLDREAERYGLDSLFDLVEHVHVLDPRVLDRQVDQYRIGDRRLSDLCRVYGVEHGGAHDPCADAVAVCAITEQIGSENSWLAEAPLSELHELQIGWAAQQQDRFREHLHRTPGRAYLASGIRTEWPVIPRTRKASALWPGRWPRVRPRPVG